MQINQATDYGFRVVLFLAGKPPGEMVEAQEIADSEAIPMRYLFKIMPSLTRAGIIASQRGVGGGYTLDRDPAEISLLDVIEAIEGPIKLNRCLIDAKNCSKNGPPECKVHQALAVVQQRLSADFKSLSLDRVIDSDFPLQADRMALFHDRGHLSENKSSNKRNQKKGGT